MANNLFTILYSKTQCLHHLSSHPHDTLSNQAFISLFHQKPCLYRTMATSILSNLIRSQFSFYFAHLQCLTQSITSTFLKLCSSLGFGIPHYFNLPSFIFFFLSLLDWIFLWAFKCASNSGALQSSVLGSLGLAQVHGVIKTRIN